MKKGLLIFVLLSSIFAAFAQTHSSIDITDDVYEILLDAETKGLCTPLSNVKPYSEKYVLDKLNEILNNVEHLKDSKTKESEKQVIQAYIKKYEHPKEGFSWEKLNFNVNNHDEERPITFNIGVSTQMLFSGGVYSDSSLNTLGYEAWGNLDFSGDLGKQVSYKTTGFIGLTKMSLEEMGQYEIGLWWYDPQIHDSSNPDHQPARSIKKLKNFNVMPYSYKKHWDGSCYYLGSVDAEGLEGWPVVSSFVFGMTGEIRASLFDEKLDIIAARQDREWAGMDKGSSLVLNSHARPFFGVEASFKLFDFLRLSTLTGVLEFPNQEYMDRGAWYQLNEDRTAKDPLSDQKYDDGQSFQNAFSIAMLDVDYKNFHFDFGSTAIWPKRFELGYMFPLLDRVIYQNDIGDYDNLGLFGDISYTFPGYAKIWGSVYLEELNSVKAHFWEKTRCMYAYQAGTKVNIPWLPFTNVSFRYTKVEPYCYTHNAIRFQPWYFGNYIATSYTNNGSCLGYYLDPNSDEFLLRFESKPIPDSSFAFQFQLIRHGVDWGSEAVKGSNLYSELSPDSRDSMYKYFLHDGVYEWITAFTLEASYNLRQHKIPVELNAAAGYYYNWFTKADGGENTNTDYHRYNSAEYQNVSGFVLSLGIKAFFN